MATKAKKKSTKKIQRKIYNIYCTNASSFTKMIEKTTLVGAKRIAINYIRHSYPHGNGKFEIYELNREGTRKRFYPDAEGVIRNGKSQKNRKK